MAEPLGGRRSGGAFTSAVALAVAVGVHALAAVTVLRLGKNGPQPAETPVELQVITTPRLSPDHSASGPSSPPVPPGRTVTPKLIRPRSHPRDIPTHAPGANVPPSRATPRPPPPPPAPTTATTTPAVFGVTTDSVITGPALIAAPIGDTTMTGEHLPGAAKGSESGAVTTGQKNKPFVPAPQMSAATLPRVLREVNSDDIYPPDARNLGLEGSVDMSIDIDESGKVLHVLVLRRAGHKFDEAAVDAMKMTSFSPARARDGRPIPFRLRYRFVFAIKN